MPVETEAETQTTTWAERDAAVRREDLHGPIEPVVRAGSIAAAHIPQQCRAHVSQDGLDGRPGFAGDAPQAQPAAALAVTVTFDPAS